MKRLLFLVIAVLACTTTASMAPAAVDDPAPIEQTWQQVELPPQLADLATSFEPATDYGYAVELFQAHPLLDHIESTWTAVLTAAEHHLRELVLRAVVLLCDVVGL
jgi:hypothetical protein